VTLRTGTAIDVLWNELGADVVTPGAQVDPRYFTAYNEQAGVRPRALVRPTCVAQISRTLEICSRFGQPVVPQGGRTGLARGAVPALPERGEIVLSLERYAGVDELDRAAATVTVRAGTLLQSLQQAVEDAGFSLGIDLGARGSCQIGGNIATNAGGNRAIRYGVMRDQVLGLEVVLADGTVVSSLNKMLKNNAGYDLKHLFIGSEGTLGVITRAVLKLHPRLATPVTALCVAADYDTVVRLWHRVREQMPTAVSFEVMWPGFYGYVARHTPDVAAPLAVQHGFYVLLECAAPGRGSETHDGDHRRITRGSPLPCGSEQGLIVDAALADLCFASRRRCGRSARRACDRCAPEPGQFRCQPCQSGSIDQFAVRCEARVEGALAAIAEPVLWAHR
jgi:FAD/FMN-containing dehydrogenase